MRRSLLSALSLPWTVLGQTHLLCPTQAASGSNLVANPSFEASNAADQWTPQQGMYYGIGKFEPADGTTYFIIPVGGTVNYSGSVQQNVTVELDTRYYGSIKVRPRVQNPTAAQSTTPRTCTATAALQGAIGGTFQDTATFLVRPAAVYDWETLGFDFKNPFTGSVRFIMTTSCDGGMPSMEMDFDDALVQQLGGGDSCSSIERPVPITGNLAPVPPTSESTTFVTSTVSPTSMVTSSSKSAPSSSTATSSSTTTTPATTDPAVSTVQVTITAAPVTTTTYTTVFVTQTTTSTVTVYASTVSTIVTATTVVATTTVTAQATVTQPVRLRRRGCRQPTASNTATSSATTSVEPSYYTASSVASTSASGTATASSGSSSATITSATASSSSSSSSSTVAITGTTTVNTTVTPTVTVDGGRTTVNVPAGTTTITQPVTTVAATATSSVTSTVTTTTTVV
ncbi:hypothetical protein Micbo1qcDRAFT_166317 [Microdochium bolleyi]|uniref:CBM-cenC domain-containing protein n=1 Tax=Microdochium bolleyi TaxID=196109 RepID=A0A136IVT5_9PEZI|nr:hypothetical protein Micbo1qcDRAFT_166317 [Microdochium bolleyi]